MHRYQVFRSVLAIFGGIGSVSVIVLASDIITDTIMMSFNCINFQGGSEYSEGTYRPLQKYIILLKRNQLFAIVQMNGQESFIKAFSDD